jgi:hypothetical protein
MMVVARTLAIIVISVLTSFLVQFLYSSRHRRFKGTLPPLHRFRLSYFHSQSTTGNVQLMYTFFKQFSSYNQNFLLILYK